MSTTTTESAGGETALSTNPGAAGRDGGEAGRVERFKADPAAVKGVAIGLALNGDTSMVERLRAEHEAAQRPAPAQPPGGDGGDLAETFHKAIGAFIRSEKGEFNARLRAEETLADLTRLTSGETDATPDQIQAALKANREAHESVMRALKERQGAEENVRTLSRAVHAFGILVPATPSAAPGGSDRLAQALAEIDPHEEAENYKYRPEGGHYETTDHEKSMLEDFATELLEKVAEAITPQPASPGAGERVQWGDPKTVGGLIAQLQTLPPDAPIFGTFHGPDFPAGGRHSTGVRGGTVPREYVKGRWLSRDPDAVLQHVIWTKPAEPTAPDAAGADVEGWQPIETAPRDDRTVLLGWYCKPTENPEDWRWVVVSGWFEAGPADRCWYGMDDERVWPTHWHPEILPPALATPPSPGSGDADAGGRR